MLLGMPGFESALGSAPQGRQITGRGPDLNKVGGKILLTECIELQMNKKRDIAPLSQNYNILECGDPKEESTDYR